MHKRITMITSLPVQQFGYSEQIFQYSHLNTCTSIDMTSFGDGNTAIMVEDSLRIVSAIANKEY